MINGKLSYGFRATDMTYRDAVLEASTEREKRTEFSLQINLSSKTNEPESDLTKLNIKQTRA